MGKTAAVNGNGVADTKPAKRKNMASNKEVLGHALVGVAVAVVLSMTGYVPNVEQTEHTMNAFHFVVSFLPGIVMMIGAIPMFFYTLTEERHAKIVAELKERRAEKENGTNN